MSKDHIALRLGGDKVASGQYICPGPGHSAADRSLSVRIVGTEVQVYSFAGDDWRLCLDHVLGLIGRSYLAYGENGAVVQNRELNAESKSRALRLWSEARPIPGTPAESYLRKRGVKYDGGKLRWHPRCPFMPNHKIGCMVALVEDILSNEPMAIHRTAMDAQGNKLSELGSNGRLALGPTKGGAVKLYDIEGPALGIGEGIESTLSIRRLNNLDGMPVWSLLNAEQLGQFPVVNGLESIWVAVDHDAAGEKALMRLVERMAASNIETIALKATSTGNDLNDVVRAEDV